MPTLIAEKERQEKAPPEKPKKVLSQTGYDSIIIITENQINSWLSKKVFRPLE